MRLTCPQEAMNQTAPAQAAPSLIDNHTCALFPQLSLMLLQPSLTRNRITARARRKENDSTTSGLELRETLMMFQRRGVN